MIKDQFTFKKNSWHIKLMKWIWGYEHSNFRNMCPYFWLSVFNILFIIPIVIVKLFLWPFLMAGEAIGRASERRSEKQKVQLKEWVEANKSQFRKDLDRGELTDLLKNVYRVYRDYYTVDEKSRKYYLLWESLKDEDTKNSDEYSKKFYSLLEEYNNILVKNEEVYYQKLRIKTRSKEQKIARLTRIFQIVFKIIKWPLLALFFIGVGWVVSYIVNHSTWSKWEEILIILLWLVAGALGVVIGVVLVAVVVELVKASTDENETFGDKSLFLKIGYILLYPFLKIGQGVVTLKDIIIALKKDNCPGLEWED